jgi:hypothetical protein
MRLPDVTRAISDTASSSSLSARTRARRWTTMLERFPDLRDLRVVDLGGEASYWRGAPVQPREVVLVNIHEHEVGDDTPWIRSVAGDACDPPEALLREGFDMVHSNSTIEHLGGHARFSAFADAVRALADKHWVQTPYRYFPIEPHWLCPGFQFLPLRARETLMRRWPIGAAHQLWKESAAASNGHARREAIEQVLWIELLSETSMRHYFPTSEIVRERVAGLTKSLVAVRGGVDE